VKPSSERLLHVHLSQPPCPLRETRGSGRGSTTTRCSRRRSSSAYGACSAERSGGQPRSCCAPRASCRSVVLARRPPGRFTGDLHGRQEQAHEHADDRDHDQELHERKAPRRRGQEAVPTMRSMAAQGMAAPGQEPWRELRRIRPTPGCNWHARRRSSRAQRPKRTRLAAVREALVEGCIAASRCGEFRRAGEIRRIPSRIAPDGWFRPEPWEASAGRRASAAAAGSRPSSRLHCSRSCSDA